MADRAFQVVWKLSPALRSSSRIPIYLVSSHLNTSTVTTNIFEPLPRKDLVTRLKSKLRDRQFLPGSTGGGFPEFLAEPRDLFPLAVRVNDSTKSSLAELTAKCMEYVEENFSRSPAILFRGLPAKTAEDFSTIAQAIQGQTMTYEGGTAFRTQIDKDVGTYTASIDPPSYTIEPHNEMAFNELFPHKVFFFCLKEPADGCGGETPLVKNSELISKLDPGILQKFEEKQIRYVRYLPDKTRHEYMNWQHAFATEDREDVEPRAKDQGYNVTWDSDGDLYLWQVRPAFIRHPVTNEKIWFNQAHSHHGSYYKAMPTFYGQEIPDDKFPCHVYYGDGSVIEPETIQHIRIKSWECAVGFQWRNGDLLVLDNLAVQHSRIGFTGDRKMLAYLTAN